MSDDLVQRFIDEPGSLEAQELEALVLWVGADGERARALRRGLVMAELLSATMAQERHGFVQRVVAARALPNTRAFTRRVLERSHSERRPLASALAWWSFAAVLVAGAVLAALWLGLDPRREGREGEEVPAEAAIPVVEVGRVLAAEGGRIERSGAVLPLAADAALAKGDRVRVGSAATVQVGGSRLVLEPDADLVVEGAHRLRLGDGRAQVAVDKTAPTDATGARLLLVTPTSEIRVVGTVFTVVATSTWTRVRLDTGVLHLANANGRIDLAPGEEAVSSAVHAPRRRANGDQRMSFALAQAEAEQCLPGFEHLADGAVITLAILPEDIVLRVIPQVDGVRSVRFRIDGGEERIEEGMPWTIVPDRSIHPALSGTWHPAPGMHLIEAAAFPQHGAKGRPLATASLVLNVR